jgi:hypothetical protein
MAAKTPATITVKVVLDTTEFDAALERVKAALRDLAATPIKVTPSVPSPLPTYPQPMYPTVWGSIDLMPWTN